MTLRKIILVLFTLIISNTFLYSQEETHNRFLGKSNAPVTIYEFGSLACVHCADFSVTILPKIKKDYINTGKVKLVFMDVPFGSSVNLFAHSVLYKTKNNNDFFKLLDTLFKNQDKIRTEDDVKVYAKLMGISDKDINYAQNNTNFHNKFMEKSKMYLETLEIEGTPTLFFVKTGDHLTKSSVKLVGTPNYSAVEREINRLLK